MLTSLWHYKLVIDTCDKMVMIMKNWLRDAKEDCPWEGDSIDDFLSRNNLISLKRMIQHGV
jgi:hypothetical protein